MIQELGARWKTVLALLIAVATALMFSTATPITPAPGNQGEAFCPPEQHDTPCISKQQSSDHTAPRGETQALAGPRLGDLVAEFQTLGDGAPPVYRLDLRVRPADGVYARGPPIGA